MYTVNRRLRFAVIVFLAIATIAKSSLAGEQGNSASKSQKSNSEAAKATDQKFFVDVKIAKCLAGKEIEIDSIKSFIDSSIQNDPLASMLSRRRLSYENRRFITESANEEYTSLIYNQEFHPDQYNKILTANNYRFAFIFELSCLPKSERYPYRLFVRAIDRSKISAILKLSTFDNKPATGDAVRTEIFDFDNLSDDLASAIQRGFSRILQMPDLVAISDEYVYDLGANVEQFFQLHSNQNFSAKDMFPSVSLEQFSVDYSVYEINGSLVASICSAPDKNFGVLDCTTKTSEKHDSCKEIDPSQLQARRLDHPKEKLSIITQREPSTGKERSVVNVRFQTASYSSVYLIRALASTSLEDGIIQSQPAYRCVQTRLRPIRFNLLVRLGLPNDLNRAESDSSWPPAGLGTAMGMDMGLTFPLSERRSEILGSSYAGFMIGFDWLYGSFPCPSRSVGDCQDPILRYQTFSVSWNGHISGTINASLWKHRLFSVRIHSSLGLGLESLSSTIKRFKNDGLHGLVLIDVGLMASLENLTRTRVSSNLALGVLFETRLRTSQTVDLTTINTLRAAASGVPDNLLTVWFTLLAEINFPHKQLNQWKNSGL